MIPIICNTAFEKLAILDDFVSFIWSSRYNSVGDFELVLNMNDVALNYIKKGYYLLREDDEHVGIVENIKIDVNADGDEQMIVSGRFIESILARRIVAEQTQFNEQKVSDVIYGLIDDAIVNPDDDTRKIAQFINGTYEVAATITCQFTGKNLLDVIQNLCEEYHLGFKITISDTLIPKAFNFNLYQGTDRTYNQSVNPYAVFSDKYDNLLTAEYLESYENLVTDVLVAGEGEGTDRKTAWASKATNTGLNRYEMYKDARNMSSDEGYISDEEYTASLVAEGMESITEYTQAFSGQVDFTNVKYKTDINLGDLCVIECSKWGININARLVEVIESINEQGVYTITPTFGL